MMSHTQQMRAEIFKNIPRAKRIRKLAQTAAGGLIFLGAWFLPLLGFPWQVAVIAAAGGGFLASKETTVGFFKLLPAVIRDLRAALRNGQ